MPQRGKSPFTEIKGLDYQAGYISKESAIATAQGKLGSQMSIGGSWIIENYTDTEIISYNRLGITQRAKQCKPVRGYVRIEMCMWVGTLSSFEDLTLRTTTKHLTEPQRRMIADYMASPVADRLRPQSGYQELRLHWDIPAQLLHDNPHGVYLDVLGIVIAFVDPNASSFAAPHVDFEYLEEDEHEYQGVYASFNKHDELVQSVWINYKGTSATKLCNNQNDPSQDEGLTVWIDGEKHFYKLTEMASNGYHLTKAAAYAEHSESNAAASGAHKQHLQEMERDYDRKLNEEKTTYDRRMREEAIVRESEQKEYERQIKEADRVNKELLSRLTVERDYRLYQDSRADKKYDREQLIVDKRPTRITSRLTVVATATTVVLGCIKFYQEVKKMYGTEGST